MQGLCPAFLSSGMTERDLHPCPFFFAQMQAQADDEGHAQKPDAYAACAEAQEHDHSAAQEGDQRAVKIRRDDHDQREQQEECRQDDEWPPEWEQAKQAAKRDGDPLSSAEMMEQRKGMSHDRRRKHKGRRHEQ